jgi:transposase InsO family protein
MRAERKFRPEFKRQVVEELLGGVSTPAQIIHRTAPNQVWAADIMYMRLLGVFVYLAVGWISFPVRPLATDCLVRSTAA